jgi:NAD(P)-dependent dehydrogenase (short-subunit alcohol dehydrogenase family)
MSNRSRLIVVTGATRGLGRAMTAGFIEAGETVAGCGRSESAVRQLQEEFGAPHRFDQVDVADDQQAAQWAQQVLAEFGPPDLLVNNAALINRNARLWELSAEEFDAVIDVNIKGVVNVIRHFVPAMIERRSGVIVNFSSGWGRSTSPKVAPYCATKWAVEGLTQALAQELPSGMAAIPLNPGIINTEMLQSCFGSSADQFADADAWAVRAVPFLLKLNASHNGQSLTAPA